MDKFLKIVTEIMEVDHATMDMKYKEGIWDSLMMLTLVMELEAEYNVVIPIESLDKIETLADLYELVKK